MSETDFLTPEESALGERFLAKGHAILPAEDRDALARIRDLVARLAAKALGIPAPKNAEAGRFLDGIADEVTVAELNEFRLTIIAGMSGETWLRPAYHALARRALAAIAGNELCMQRRINLSIQLPDDDSSLLPIHADVWSGDSPFEVVLWVPLVDCFRTKSMYLLPPESNAALQRDMAARAGVSAEDVYRAVEKDVCFLDVSFGQVLLFSQNLAHGNRVNREPTTRWTMNCRFKGVFTPYADKKLGEFFEPVTLRPASRLGLDYRLPGGFERNGA